MSKLDSTSGVTLLAQLSEQLKDEQNWKNIQEVVKTTFLLMSDILQQQTNLIKKLEKEKVSMKDYIAGMKTKADDITVVSKLDEINGKLDLKASKRNVAEMMSKKADKTELAQISNEMTEKMKETISVVNPAATISDMAIQIENKADKQDFQKMRESLNHLKQEVSSKANKEEVNKQLEKKAGINEVRTSLNKKCDKEEIEGELAKKANRASVVNALKQKASVQSVNEALMARPTMEQVEEMMKKKAEKKEIEKLNEEKLGKEFEILLFCYFVIY